MTTAGVWEAMIVRDVARMKVGGFRFRGVRFMCASQSGYAWLRRSAGDGTSLEGKEKIQ